MTLMLGSRTRLEFLKCYTHVHKFNNFLNKRTPLYPIHIQFKYVYVTYTFDHISIGFSGPAPFEVGTPSIVSSTMTSPSVVLLTPSATLELDAPASNSIALNWQATSSISEALLAASNSWRSFFQAWDSSSSLVRCLLARSRGGGGGTPMVQNRATNNVSSTGSVKEA